MGIVDTRNAIGSKLGFCERKFRILILKCFTLNYELAFLVHPLVIVILLYDFLLLQLTISFEEVLQLLSRMKSYFPLKGCHVEIYVVLDSEWRYQ
jgi:hypothetical protein